MVLRTLLIIIIAGLLGSCAQVGFLTGGEEDFYAPEPVRSMPENGSVSFTGSEIKMYFDEFIQLKDPNQNIFIVPNDARIEAKLHKKELTLSWQETLQPNTTYVVYLNNAVLDATEGNSSLYSYVFSTGTTLDTLTRTFYVKDAASNAVVPKTTVGLFTSQDSLRPFYFSETDALGMADFQYLKKGDFFVRAFKDENKDLQISETEACGFLASPVLISADNSDTLGIQLFNPRPKKFINRFEFKAPGILELELSAPLSEPEFELNQQQADSTLFRFVNQTMIRIMSSDSILQNTKLSVKEGEKIDSASLRITARERSASLIPALIDNSILPLGSSVHFQVNSFIQHFDISKISVRPSNDSLKLIPFKLYKEKDVLSIFPETAEGGKYRITIADGAINSVSKSFQSEIELKTKKELGTLMLVPEKFSGPIVVELLKDKKVIGCRVLKTAENVLFENLIPGDYTARVVEDVNGNGIWDTGDLEEKKQPEKIFSYDVPVRVRANWDMKLTLTGKP